MLPMSPSHAKVLALLLMWLATTNCVENMHMTTPPPDRKGGHCVEKLNMHVTTPHWDSCVLSAVVKFVSKNWYHGMKVIFCTQHTLSQKYIFYCLLKWMTNLCNVINWATTTTTTEACQCTCMLWEKTSCKLEVWAWAEREKRMRTEVLAFPGAQMG